MQALLIRGGRPLAGEIEISGSKNAVLPMLAASVLFRRGCVIRSCPELTDVDAAVEILRFLGAQVRRCGSMVCVDPGGVCRWEIPPALMNRMRGSVFFAGALMARLGRCRISQPGGCSLGSRPVDFHAAGLRALGAEECPGDPGAFCGGLTGGRYVLPYPSVGATENLLMAALGAQGPTQIRNAAREPEICCLCDFLRLGGCSIRGDGSRVLDILPGLPDRAEMAPIPDRMEAATFCCATACAGGQIRLARADPAHLVPVLDALERAGCGIVRSPDSIELACAALRSPGLALLLHYSSLFFYGTK